MKTLITVLMVLLVLWVPSAYAIAPVNEDMIKEAQDYGRDTMQLELKEFVAPWTAYEEKAVTIGDGTERAFFYTPYLLIAHHARDRAKGNQSVKIVDTEQILSDYAGYYSFTVVLYGETSTFMEKARVTIKQDKKTIEAADLTVTVPEAITVTTSKKPAYSAKAYIYFQERDIRYGKPITLVLFTGDKRSRSFYFDVAKLK